jgi:hypothetical protein
MKDNDRLFAMRSRAEKTLALIKQMNEAFDTNKDENIILVIMASNYDSFWEGWTWHRDEKKEKIESLMKDFCRRFYASDYYTDRDKDIKTFLQSQGYKYE